MEAKRIGLPQWQAWQYMSLDNPTLAREEIAAAKDQLSEQLFAQEYEASFSAESGTIFQAGWWVKNEMEPPDGEYYIAVDLAGFANVGSLKKKELKIRDESAIAVVKVNRDGWFVKEIQHGQWDVRKTALMIMNAYRTYRPVRLGIEKGMAKNAVMPYLEDEMKRLDVYFTPFELSHGNEKKFDRIRWALQGRAEKGRITLNTGSASHSEWDGWARRLVKQAADFPSSLAHDDLLDALSYIDQLASVVYFNDMIQKEDPYYDDLIGF
jgi:hypothetical protein